VFPPKNALPPRLSPTSTKGIPHRKSHSRTPTTDKNASRLLRTRPSVLHSKLQCVPLFHMSNLRPPR
jgi:hypothetical protein